MTDERKILERVLEEATGFLEDLLAGALRHAQTSTALRTRCGSRCRRMAPSRWRWSRS